MAAVWPADPRVLLLADGLADLIRVLGPIGFFVLYILAQVGWRMLTGGPNRGGLNAPGGAGERPAPGRRLQPPQPPAGGQADPVAELEAFLRRAADVAQGRAAPPADQNPPGPPPLPPSQRKRRRGRKQPALQSKPPTSETVEVELVDRPRRTARKPLGSEVRQHVATHLNTDEFSHRGEKLSDLDQTDERMDARIHRDLDHEVGSLSNDVATIETAPGQATGAAGPGGSPTGPVRADTLAGRLRDPSQLAQVFVLQEIFRRPEERW